MKLNKIQVQIFYKLSSELNMELEEYLLKFSGEYIDRVIKTLEELTEKEGDTWITITYLKSLG